MYQQPMIEIDWQSQAGLEAGSPLSGADEIT